MSFYPAKGGGAKKPYYVSIDAASSNSSGGFDNKYFFDVSDIEKIELVAYSGTFYTGTLQNITVTTYGSNNTLFQNVSSSSDVGALQRSKYTTKINSSSYAGKNVNPSNPIDIPISTSYKSMCIDVRIPDYNWNGLVVYKVYPR